MEWIKTSEQLPEAKERNYQVIALCRKKYVGGNYDGEPKKTIVQDWVVRQWPNNFLYWSIIPALPQPSQKEVKSALEIGMSRYAGAMQKLAEGGD